MAGHMVQIILSSEGVEKLVFGHIINMEGGEASIVKVEDSPLIDILMKLKDVMTLLEHGVLNQAMGDKLMMFNSIKPTVITGLGQLTDELHACRLAIQSSKESLILKLHDWGMQGAVKQGAGVSSNQPTELLKTQYSLRKDHMSCNELIYLVDTIKLQLEAGTMVTLSSPFNITGFNPDEVTEGAVNKAMAGANPSQKAKMKADLATITNPKNDTVH